MKKKLSKGMMHPMLLDYLLRFGTEWRTQEETKLFRVETWLRIKYDTNDNPFWQALEFGFIERREKRERLSRALDLYYDTDLYRLTPKGMRRIARG